MTFDLAEFDVQIYFSPILLVADGLVLELFLKKKYCMVRI